jgi:putative hydrolases of HD superfamily
MIDMNKKLNVTEKVTRLLYEIGTLRKVARAHRQTLLTDDLSDNIASHSFRVTWIGMLLAKMEKADTDKVVKMCLLHDLPESRSGDQNWVHKRYVKVFEEEIIDSQFDGEIFADLKDLAVEYHERKTDESKIAKDADLLDQVLLLMEYSHMGNKEAELWLEGNRQANMLSTKSGKKLLATIRKTRPGKWWSDLWTSDRRE